MDLNNVMNDETIPSIARALASDMSFHRNFFFYLVLNFKFLADPTIECVSITIARMLGEFTAIILENNVRENVG